MSATCRTTEELEWRWRSTGFDFGSSQVDGATLRSQTAACAVMQICLPFHLITMRLQYATHVLAIEILSDRPFSRLSVCLSVWQTDTL